MGRVIRLDIEYTNFNFVLQNLERKHSRRTKVIQCNHLIFFTKFIVLCKLYLMAILGKNTFPCFITYCTYTKYSLFSKMYKPDTYNKLTTCSENVIDLSKKPRYVLMKA